VSSSGHLVVVPALLGWKQPSLTFDLVLHLATLLAAVFALRRELIALVLGLLGRGEDPAGMRRLLGFLVVGSIPAGIVGLAFGGFLEDRFDDPLTTCAELVATGLILVVVERLIHGEPGDEPVDTPKAVAIGIAQAVAILPGISRSGSTIATALGLRMSRKEATRFSFLLSIPAIGGAVLTKVPDVVDGRFRITGSVIAGFVAATVVGWISIDWLLRYVRSHSLLGFAYYLFVFAPIAALIIELR
jgi:undecaprenyl-diphosphatase